MQRFQGGLVFKAHRLCASLSSRLESIETRRNGGRVNLGTVVQGRAQEAVGLVRVGTWVRVEGLGLRS